MGTILDSTKELSKKLGVEAEEQTIKDQIDAINESIDENFGGSVDIAEAVRTYSENAGGGGGGFTKIRVTYTTGISREYCDLLRSSDGQYTIPDRGFVICLDPVSNFTNFSEITSYIILFTPSENFVRPDGVQGDEITPGDGKLYRLYWTTNDPTTGQYFPKSINYDKDFIAEIQ